MEEQLKDDRLYEIATDEKKHNEQRRDEVTRNYTSLFTAIIAIMPFINNFIENHDAQKYDYLTKFLQLLLPMIGLILSISWIGALKRIYLYLEGIDNFLVDMEKNTINLMCS